MSLAKKIVAGIQANGDSAELSAVQARAAIDLATEALSQRIIAAVDEISNPKASAPKATKQLAAKMAKIIVEAAASKADAPSKAIRTFSFANRHGEEYELTVDASGTSGILAGDETDWENLHIRDDRLEDDFMFNSEELAWLRKSWRSATGRYDCAPKFRHLRIHFAVHLRFLKAISSIRPKRPKRFCCNQDCSTKHRMLPSPKAPR